MNTERIDGKEYEIGTPEHAMAKAQAQARADAAYVAQHAPLVEQTQRALRDMPNLNDRVRSDANATLFLARDLVFVRAQIERTIYERIRAAEFVPVETNHPRGAQSYATRLATYYGDAKITTDLAGDAPRADAALSEDLRKYVNVRASYGYTVQELEHAAFAGIGLDRMKADACADVIARGVDRIGRSGNAVAGLTGFFNNALVPQLTLTNGEWIIPPGPLATPAEVIADWAQIEQTIITNAGDNMPAGDKPFTLVVPNAVEGRLASTPQAVGSDMSLLKYLIANARVIGKVERYSVLDTAVSPDIAVADAPQMIAYYRDPSVLFWPMPIMYEEQVPELRGWEYLVQARARCGGVEVRRPMHMLYVTNVD
jgi:hypothetical protein